MSELRHDPSRDFLDAPPERIVSLHESTNQPHVQAGGAPSQAAHATIAAVQLDDGRCEVAVALHLPDTRRNVIYAGPPLAPQSVPAAVEDAVLFAESMGFILDNTGWPTTDEATREELYARSPALHRPKSAADAVPGPREKPKDALAAVARLFAAFALLLWAAAGAGCATGMSAEQRTKDAEIHYDLGTNLLKDGDAQGALREFLQAEHSNPELAPVHASLGFVYAFSLNRPAEAEEQFRRAIDIEPNYSEALNNFGAFYLSRGRFAEAIPLFEKALANPLYTERFIAESNLGWALYKTGQADRGVGRLRGALLVAPKYCKGWRSLGTIYSETGKLPEAEEAFGKYAQTCPDVADAHLLHGKVLSRLGRADDAKAEFGRCAKGSPEKEAAVIDECARFLKELAAQQ